MVYELFLIGIGLVMVGFFILLAYLLIKSKREVKGGGFILIGPIPIVFSTDKKIGYALLIGGIILTLLAIILFILFVSYL